MNKVPYLFKKGEKATYHINNKPLKYIPYVKSQYGFNSKFKEVVSLLNIEPVYFNGIEVYILDAKQVKNIFKSKIEENPYYFITKN